MNQKQSIRLGITICRTTRWIRRKQQVSLPNVLISLLNESYWGQTSSGLIKRWPNWLFYFRHQCTLPTSLDEQTREIWEWLASKMKELQLFLPLHGEGRIVFSCGPQIKRSERITSRVSHNGSLASHYLVGCVPRQRTWYLWIKGIPGKGNPEARSL